MKFIEQEAKFRIRYPQKVRTRLEQLGAVLILDHQHEMNIRFDKPDGSFKLQHKVLRLRIDQVARLTYKGAAEEGAEVSVRKEVEINVDDAEAAKAFLNSLGFQAVETYEKFRTTYHYQGLEIVLDELPFGHFVEIEGDNLDRIRAVAQALLLDWDRRCKLSYLELFYRLNEKRGQSCPDLTFASLPASDEVEDLLDAQIADD